ncbi:PX domain containing protein, putative [Entamoeba histolytica]
MNGILGFDIKVTQFTQIEKVDYYQIELFINGIKRKQILRRYNDLSKFNEELTNKFGNLIPSFPPATVYFIKPTQEQRMVDFHFSK